MSHAASAAMTVGVVFSGQGSQSVGMLAELGAEFPVVRETFAQASEVLGHDLWRLAQEGPAERLNSTLATQPVMLAAGVAVWRAWRQCDGPQPRVMAGHSLGEYSALVAAGALEFGAAVSLVAERARLMQAAVPAGEGQVAAVLGLDDHEVIAVCAAAAEQQVVSAVNFNAPGQVVIAGHTAAVARAIERARGAGARRAMVLPLSVPVHCALMEPAAARFAERLATTRFGVPPMPILSNVDLAPHEDPAAMRINLARQLHCPVRWTETIRQMAAQGVTVVVECGPGKVLTGLNRRIERAMRALPVFDPTSLHRALAAIRGEDAPARG